MCSKMLHNERQQPVDQNGTDHKRNIDGFTPGIEDEGGQQKDDVSRATPRNDKKIVSCRKLVSILTVTAMSWSSACNSPYSAVESGNLWPGRVPRLPFQAVGDAYQIAMSPAELGAREDDRCNIRTPTFCKRRFLTKNTARNIGKNMKMNTELENSIWYYFLYYYNI